MITSYMGRPSPAAWRATKTLEGNWLLTGPGPEYLVTYEPDEQRSTDTDQCTRHPYWVWQGTRLEARRESLMDALDWVLRHGRRDDQQSWL